jgi:hypothetical protein
MSLNKKSPIFGSINKNSLKTLDNFSSVSPRNLPSGYHARTPKQKHFITVLNKNKLVYPKKGLS